MKSCASILLVAGVLLAGGLLSGCWTVSLHPLFTDDTLTYDERLLGTWKNEDATAVFTPAGDGKYRIQYTENAKTSLLDARLVKLEEQRYLDVDPPPQDDGDVADVHRVPAHSFWKVSWEGDALRLTLMDFDWLRELLEKDPKAISSARVDKDFILLTASTSELQQFVRSHAPQAFKEKEGGVWQREPPPKKD
ncbi:MAG: hypothetical protein ACRD24_06450 [Terriglobales bacterium]